MRTSIPVMIRFSEYPGYVFEHVNLTVVSEPWISSYSGFDLDMIAGVPDRKQDTVLCKHFIQVSDHCLPCSYTKCILNTSCIVVSQ